MSRYRFLLHPQRGTTAMCRLAAHSIRPDRFETAYQKPHPQKNRTKLSRTPPELQNRCWQHGSIVSMSSPLRPVESSSHLALGVYLAMTSGWLPSLSQMIH